MKKLFSVGLLAIVPLLLTACGGSKPSAEIKSVEYVDSINASGVSYSFEDMDIIKIVFDFKFNESIVSGIDSSGDDYRQDLFIMLAEGAHFHFDDQEIEHEYGYWPQDTGSDYAKEMTLFYVVPSGHAVESLRFVYDGTVLGEGASGIDTQIDPE